MNKHLLKFCIKIGRKISDNKITQPLAPIIANFYLNNFVDKNKIFEFQGFKIKRGRTTIAAILEGTTDMNIVNLMENKIKLGMNVVDLGSNLGLLTLKMSKLVGPTGHVYSFEPDPQLFQILNENIKLNQLENVSTFQFAVSNKSGKAVFSQNFKADGDGRLESKSMLKNTIDVDIIKLDDFCEKNTFNIDFIKMDVQGSELKVFEGMKQLISYNKHLQIITEFSTSHMIDVGSVPQDFITLIEQLGFIIKVISEGEIDSWKTFDKYKNFFKTKGEIDLYCYKT